jgi:hypothetical protein
MKKLISLFFIVFSLELFAIMNVAVIETGTKDGFNSDLELAIETDKGNTESLEYEINGFATYFFDSQYWLVDFNHQFEKNDDLRTKNRYYFHLRNVINIYQKMSDSNLNKIDFEYFGQIENDEFLFLKLRSLAGLGLRIKPLKKYKLFFGLSPMLVRESYFAKETNSKSAELFIRLNEYIFMEYNINKDFKVYFMSYFQPMIFDWSDFQSRNTFVLEFKFMKKFKIANKISFIYDSEPLENIKKYDFSQKTVFGMDF